MALAKIVGLAVTPRIPSATSLRSVPSRRYTRVRLSSQGLWPCSWCRRWSLVMSSLLSSARCRQPAGHLVQGDVGVSEPRRVDRPAAADQGLDRPGDVPNVGAHAGHHPLVLEPEGD